MRAFGFALVVIGIVVIWLSVQGKMGAAFSALITGQVPTTSSSAGSSGSAPPNPGSPTSAGQGTGYAPGAWGPTN